MGNQGNFASTPHNTSTTLSGTIETNLSVPTHATSCFSAGAAGSKIEEIVVEAVATTLLPITIAGLVYLFLYDGTTYHLFDTVPVTAVTASVTVAPFRSAPARYPNLSLESGWFLYGSISAAPTTGLLQVHCFGGDY